MRSGIGVPCRGGVSGASTARCFPWPVAGGPAGRREQRGELRLFGSDRPSAPVGPGPMRPLRARVGSSPRLSAAARHALERPVGRRPRGPVPEAVQEILFRLLSGGEGLAACLVPGGHADHGGIPLGGRGQGECVLTLGGPALCAGARPPALRPAPPD